MKTKTISRLSTSCIAAFLTFSLAGCEQYIRNWEEVNEIPDLEVHEVDYTHSVRFDPVTNQPDDLEMIQMGQFLNRLRIRNDDRIEIRYRDNLQQHKQAAILKAVLEDQGYPVDISRFAEENSEDTGKTAPLQIAVKKAVVKLPDCPDWSDRPGRTYNNLATSNFGCSNVTNLGLMIDRPEDLVAGRGTRIFDGTLAASSIERYRKRETTPLKVDDFGLVGERSSEGQGGNSQ